jgi:hypothetical protein
MDTLDRAPAWLLRPLPLNAARDEELHARIDQVARRLPESLPELDALLRGVKVFREYDAAANHASLYIWAARERFSGSDAGVRLGLLTFAREHMAEEACARLCRRLVKDPSPRVRQRAARIVRRSGFHEVALPRQPDGTWDSTGWLAGTEGPLARHAHGTRVLARHGLPPLANLAALRELLEVRSARQLGFFLLASDRDNGPYTRFTIPKRDGGERTICAPKKQLRWVQRHILDKVLARVPAHESAHGFIRGRSTLTNATPHKGARVLVKFDLTDFFPTIHYYRVVGLFASLGYPAGNGRFSAADESTQVAPTLARLCCYTPDPFAWDDAALPQGAPTSPAISNIVCRRLDARLAGLARRNKAVYTRYADDLAFSFRERPAALGRFRWWVDQVCHQEGFFVNQRKFRVIRASQRQLVTGIVVNDELRVPREMRRRLRAILHNCRRDGLEAQARGRPDFAGYLHGLASYIHMVDPEEGTELLRQVDELLGPDTDEGQS